MAAWSGWAPSGLQEWGSRQSSWHRVHRGSEEEVLGDNRRGSAARRCRRAPAARQDTRPVHEESSRGVFTRSLHEESPRRVLRFVLGAASAHSPLRARRGLVLGVRPPSLRQPRIPRSSTWSVRSVRHTESIVSGPTWESVDTVDIPKVLLVDRKRKVFLVSNRCVRKISFELEVVAEILETTEPQILTLPLGRVVLWRSEL